MVTIHFFVYHRLMISLCKYYTSNIYQLLFFSYISLSKKKEEEFNFRLLQEDSNA